METEIQKLNNQVQDLTDKINYLNDLYFRTFNIDKTLFQNPVYINGGIKFKDPTTISTGSTTGMKIGNATTEKLGFYNKTPVVQAGAISAPNTQGGTYSQSDVQSIVTAVNSIRTALTNLGLTA